MGYIYGKLNKEIERVSLGGGENEFAKVTIDDNLIYVEPKTDRVFDLTSNRAVQNKIVTSKFNEVDSSLMSMCDSIDKQWSLVRHLNNVVDEQIRLIAQYDKESRERDADLLDKLLGLKAALEKDVSDLARFIERYEEELTHLKEVDLANEKAIEALKTAYELKMTELDATDESIRTDISSFKEVYNEAVNAFTNEDIRINGRIDALIDVYTQKMTELDAKDAEIIQSIVDAIAQHNQDIEGLCETHSKDIEAVRGELSSSITELTNKHNQDIDVLTSKHNTDIAELGGSLNSTISQMESKYDAQLSEMENKYDSKIANVEKSHKSDVESINSAISDLDSAYQAKIAELEESDESNSAALTSHDTSETSHTDIRDLITSLDNRLNTLLGDEDATKALSDLLNYLKENGDLIGTLDSKVSYDDIVDDLTTEESSKPLSAKQGKVLSDAISKMSTEVSELSDTVYNELSSLLEVDFIVGGTAPVPNEE